MNFNEQVVEFNTKVLKIEQRAICALEPAEYEITLKCLREELDEFTQAVESGDFISSIDALIDLKYFAVGALYKMGLSADAITQCDSAVHEANMEKKLGVNARRAVEGAADAVKPLDWMPPELRIIDILDSLGK